MKKKSMVCMTLFAAIPFAFPPSVRAETDMTKFGLCRAAPADAFITVAARGNAERDFLEVYWKGVTDAFMESGIPTDIWDLITEQVSDEDLAEVEEIKQRFTQLCGNVGWSELFEKEMVYAGRFTSLAPSAPPMYEGVVIGRMKDAETAAKNYEAVHAILTELSKLIEAKAGRPVLLVTTESRKDGLTLAKTSFADAPFMELNVATRKDLMFMTFGSPKILSDALANLSDSKDAQRIVDTTRFASAFSTLPAAEDTIVFFDVERMLSTFRGLMASMERMGAKPAGANNDAPPSEEALVGKALGQVLGDVSIIDYMATVEWTENHRVFSESRTTLRDGAKSSPVYKILGADKSVKEFAKYVPRESTSFNVCSGIDLAATYDYVIHFVEKNVPDGEQAIKNWNDMQQNELKLNVRDDVLALIEGTSYNVTLGNDSVSMTRLTDEKKAAAQITRLIGFIKTNVGEEQGLAFIPVKVGPESELYQLSHPMLMMQGFSPVFGCADGYFIFSTSADAVKKCLQTGRGKHASIKESGPWKEQALMPDGAVQSIAFTDQDNLAKETQDQINALYMGLGFAQIAAGQLPPELKNLLTAANRIVPKLLPVAAKLNFFKSNASYTTFDGNAWTTRSVQNYKSPAEVKKLEEASASR